jgi:ABC-type glycerol-3-phosphate transport system substrate-binding protein
MLAINAGNAPDVSMNQLASQPMEYAFRGAVADLARFDDFAEVKKRFHSELFVPMSADGRVYGLPETMGFRLLFYRRDILNELKLSPPATWDELYQRVLPVLNRNGMQFYFPALYDVFLYQYKGSYYDEQGLKSGLDTPEAYLAFKELCELYRSYGVPLAASFFNRFRSGEMPIGIGDSAFYIQLLAAAPELNGLWSMALIPGHENNGELDRTVGPVAADAVIILNSSKKKVSAWAFLKWWTEDKTQQDFALHIESGLGVGARWISANLNAFASLSWRPFEKELITQQMEWVRETPIYLGSYFSGRHISNAFNKVVVSNLSARDSLEKATEDITKEMKRKREQFGYPD